MLMYLYSVKSSWELMFFVYITCRIEIKFYLLTYLNRCKVWFFILENCPAQANRKFPVQLYVKIQIFFEPPFWICKWANHLSFLAMSHAPWWLIKLRIVFTSLTLKRTYTMPVCQIWLFVLLETNFFTFEAKCIILDNVCPIVEKRYWKLFENH